MEIIRIFVLVWLTLLVSISLWWIISDRLGARRKTAELIKANAYSAAIQRQIVDVMYLINANHKIECDWRQKHDEKLTEIIIKLSEGKNQ